MARQKSNHRWRFFRAGGFEQVLLDSGADLLALRHLDQKLWAALACPSEGIELDKDTLALVDADGDGRIRAPELLAAIAWAGKVVKDPDALLAGSAKVPLSSLADTPEGKRVRAAARRLLANLGKKEATEITLEDTTDRARVFAEMKLNGDGVVPPASTDDEDVRKAIEDTLSVTGGVKDRNGQDGVTREKLDEFFGEAEAYSKWLRAADDDAEHVLPLGAATGAAAEATRAVKAKIEDYFTRVKLAAFDARAAAPLARDVAEYGALSSKLLSDAAEEVAAFPLARIEASRPLPLAEGLNPAWAAPMARFVADAVTPLLGERAELTEADFRALLGKLAPHEAWLAAKAGARVEPLGKDRVRALLEGEYRQKIADLVAQDQALAPEAEAIAEVDKLVRFHRDLRRLAESFVTFRDFYGRKKATFQAGTLYIDGKSCDLCVRVTDAAAHAAIAARSEAYLIYCDLERKSKGEKMTIVAAVTAGDTDALVAGRNGVFYDRSGDDWDARVTRVVSNPISLRQAFWMPYKRALRLIEEQLQKLAASRDKELESKTAKGVSDTSALATAPPPAPAPAGAPGAPGAKPAAGGFDIAKYVGIMAAIGLAVGALGAAFAAIVTGFLSLRWWQMPLVVIGIFLLISGPSMLIAYMKLRRRNIAPILDPSGWAVNAQARLNVPFGASLTQLAAVPPGAERSLADPYAEKKRPWLLYGILLLILGAGVYFYSTGQLQIWLRELQSPPAPPAAAPAPSAPAP